MKNTKNQQKRIKTHADDDNTKKRMILAKIHEKS